MPIQVVCPGCKKRFAVSEKFAGKEGPCPQCKTKIKIPDVAEEVTIHAPDDAPPGVAGGKTATGQPTFKPIRRKHWAASPITVVAIVGGIAVTLVAALFIRLGTSAAEPVSTGVLVIGAIALAFPLSWGGYLFLSDPDLEGYQGTAMYVRVGICALVYALLWGVWAFLRPRWGFEGPIDLPFLVFIVPGIVAVGAIAPFAALDFEYLKAAFHYGIYLGATVLLRVIVHLPPF